MICMNTMIWFLSFMYICHLANMSNLTVLKPLAFIDKLFRLLLGITLLITWTFNMIILNMSKSILDVETIENLCFDYTLFICGKLFPKIIGLRTVYTKHFDKTVPMVYICNHHNFTDGLVLTIANIKAYWIAKEGLEKEIPFLGILLKYAIQNANFIFYKRYEKDEKVKKHSGEIVKNQVVDIIKKKLTSVVVYPDGTSTRCGVPLSKYAVGMFHNTFDNDIPVCPISIHYTKQIGHGVKDKPTIKDFFEIIDLTVVCEPGEIIIKHENEEFDAYYDRIKGTLSTNMYEIY
jgi:1-acyl-sn-glycerol-3-phosphate acyltransferase